jgi:cytochrome c oxidase subunit 1
VYTFVYVFRNGETEFPIGEPEENADITPRIFENWWLWIGIVVALILIAYALPFSHMLQHGPMGSKGFKTY